MSEQRRQGERRQSQRDEAQEAQEARRFNMPRPVLIVGAIALLVALVVVGRFCSAATTINVTVNGAPLTLHGAKTMEVAVRESGLPINPGDLISLQGNVLKRNAGHPFYATVNGEETDDPNFTLSEGADIQVTDGKDIVEDYDVVEEARPHSATVYGSGTFCRFVPGRDGVLEHRTGRLSGETVDKTTVKPQSTEATWYDVNVGDDKVIALTFEQGPSDEYTEQILDILAVNDARATFFCVGKEVEAHPDIVRRESGAYNQVCTNTYDRDWTDSDSPDELVEEVEKGVQAIADALETDQVSRVVRLPDSDLDDEMAAALDRHVTTVAKGNLSTGDWLSPSVNSIYETLLSAEPGDVVLLTDGGGNRENTVEALRKALPELKAQGYSFITVDELLRYPAYGDEE